MHKQTYKCAIRITWHGFTFRHLQQSIVGFWAHDTTVCQFVSCCRATVLSHCFESIAQRQHIIVVIECGIIFYTTYIANTIIGTQHRDGQWRLGHVPVKTIDFFTPMLTQTHFSLQINKIVIQYLCFQAMALHQFCKGIEIIANSILHLLGQFTDHLDHLSLKLIAYCR